MWRDTQENKQSDRDFELYFAIVRQIGELSRSRHQKFVIGLIKAREDSFGGTHYSNAIFRQRLEGVADEVIDLTLADTIEKLDKKFRIHELDPHPTATANDKRAQVLVNVFGKYSPGTRLPVGNRMALTGAESLVFQCHRQERPRFLSKHVDEPIRGVAAKQTPR